MSTRSGPWRMILALCLLAVAAPAAGQTVRRVGSSDVALDRRLARLLDADPLIITEDRRLYPGDTIRQSVLVLDATLIHEGTIAGDLVLVDAGAFLRPGSVVEGDLVNVAGGLYRSERARVGGTIIDLPDASYRVDREGEGGFVIEATRTPSRMVLDGFAGFTVPTYDRVNGVTVTWGEGYRLPRVAGLTPWLRAHVGWRTALGDPTYGGSFEVQGGAFQAAVGYERESQTRDAWAVGDLRTTLNYLWDGDDFRDYYDAERTWVSLTRDYGDVAKRFYAVVRVAGQMEDAVSLGGGEPWHLWGDSTRTNPSVDEGRISSVLGRLDLEWHGFTTDLEAGAEYEAGRKWQGGEYTFDRMTAWARFAMAALFNHSLEINAFGQLPVSGDTLPRQRWTFVGGLNRLETQPIGSLRGDHVLLVATRYRIPTPDAIALPLLGAPEIQLYHTAGKGWLEGDDTALVQEVGAGLQFFGLYVKYLVQPDNVDRNAVVVGLNWPFSPAFPWER